MRRGGGVKEEAVGVGGGGSEIIKKKTDRSGEGKVSIGTFSRCSGLPAWDASEHKKEPAASCCAERAKEKGKETLGRRYISASTLHVWVGSATAGDKDGWERGH